MEFKKNKLYSIDVWESSKITDYTEKGRGSEYNVHFMTLKLSPELLFEIAEILGGGGKLA